MGPVGYRKMIRIVAAKEKREVGVLFVRRMPSVQVRVLARAEVDPSGRGCRTGRARLTRVRRCLPDL
jgi:hypothetical protein